MLLMIKDSIGFSAHGFRATASTIFNEAGYRAAAKSKPGHGKASPATPG